MPATALLAAHLRSLTGADTSHNDTSGTRARARPPPRPSAAPGAAPEVTEPPLFSGRKPGRPRGTHGAPAGTGGGERCSPAPAGLSGAQLALPG